MYNYNVKTQLISLSDDFLTSSSDWRINSVLNLIILIKNHKFKDVNLKDVLKTKFLPKVNTMIIFSKNNENKWKVRLKCRN